MSLGKTLYIVHCIDTEGPMKETLQATFDRLYSLFGIAIEATPSNLYKIQNQELELNGKEDEIANCFAPHHLKYNETWEDIESMLDELLSNKFRNQVLDSYQGGWVYSWHCMDHLGLSANPRQKEYGYGKIFDFYSKKLSHFPNCKDEINWHFHPLSLRRNPLSAATSFVNNYDLLNEALCRRIIEHDWFPVVNRPGFHSERPDSHLFLEQWIPFDYANQRCDSPQNQPDELSGRFGDWSRAPQTWCGYNPSHDDYQERGNCRRLIFRCLNVGTRMRLLTESHVSEAFLEAQTHGSAILAFANHDWRDMRPDINYVLDILNKIKVKFPDVNIKYTGAQEAAVALTSEQGYPQLRLEAHLEKNQLIVKCTEGKIFGPQPFLAIKSIEGIYFHDNFDVITPGQIWSYFFDDQTIDLAAVEVIGVGSAGRFGGFYVEKLLPFRTIDREN